LTRTPHSSRHSPVSPPSPLSENSTDFPSTPPASGNAWSFDRNILLSEAEALGAMTRDEKVVATVQGLLMLMWVLRPLLLEPYLGTCNDSSYSTSYTCPSGQWVSRLKNYDCGFACMAAISLFLIPSSVHPGKRILTWEVVNSRFPWELLLIFGAGFALAEGFKLSGLSSLIADSLSVLSVFPSMILCVIVCTCVSFLTEVTTAIGLATIFLPIVAAASSGLRTHPLILMLGSATCCSLAFMLPLATPPNLLVYGTGKIEFWTMAKPGVWMNLIGALIATFWVFFTGAASFGQVPFDWKFPEWADASHINSTRTGFP